MDVEPPLGPSPSREDYDNLGRVRRLRPTQAVVDTFTQPDGNPKDPNKWISIGSPVVTGNKLTLDSASGSGVISANRTHPDRIVGFTYRFADVTATKRAYLDLIVRNQASPENRLQIRLTSDSTTAAVTSIVNGTSTSIGTFTTPALEAGADRKIQARFVGTDLKIWVWPADQDRPATPTFDGSETTITNGESNRILVSKATSATSTQTITIDDFSDVDPTNGEAPIAEFTYDNDGNVLTETKAASATGYGGTQTWSYGATTGQLNSVTNTFGGSPAKTYNLTYDTAGDIKTAFVPGYGTYTYSYDQAGQLTGSTRGYASDTQVWTYDRGRLATAKTGTAAPTVYSYNDRSQLTTITPPTGTPTSLTYDGAGRRLSEATGTTNIAYSYDQAGRTTGTTTTNSGTVTASETRLLSPEGLVRSSTMTTGGTATTTLIDWNTTTPVAQMASWNTSSGGTRTFLRGPTSWAATIQGKTWRPIVTDPHGSVLAIGSQSAAHASTYDPWGKPDTTTTGSPRIGYRGELTLGTTLNLRNRDYQPTWGQFTSEDPLPDTIGSAVAGNPYHYVNNTPLNQIDPLGLSGIRSGVSDDAINSPGYPIGSIGDFFGGMWDQAKSFVTSAAESLRAGFSLGVTVAKCRYLYRCDDLTSTVNGMWTGIRQSATSMWSAIQDAASGGPIVPLIDQLGALVDLPGIGTCFQKQTVARCSGKIAGQIVIEVITTVGAGAAVARLAARFPRIANRLRKATNTFPSTADELTGRLGVDPVRSMTKDGTPRFRWEPNERTRITMESHPEGLTPGDVGFNPRHHGEHFHVQTRPTATTGWNNPAVTKILPPGYTPGSGTGFLPGEAFPG